MGNVEKLKSFIIKSKYVFLLVFLVTVIYLVICGPYLLTDTPFLLGADARMQYLQFYSLLEDNIANGFSFYSNNTFLGNDFYSTRLFLNFDILDYISAYFKIDYFSSTMILTYIRSLIGALCFYKYAKNLNWKPLICIILALCFTYNSWSLDSMKDPFFHSFYVLIPLYFLSIERYLKNNKIILFVVMTSYLAVNSYYMFYTLSLFTVIYFIYRYYTINLSFENLIKSAIKLIGYYFIAVMIASFALVPSILNVMGNSRVFETSNLILFDSIKVYISMLLSLFNYTSTTINRVGDFTSILYHSSELNNTLLYVSISSSMYISLILFQTFFKNCINYKANKVLFLLFSIMLFIPFFSSAMHGFSAPNFRWSFTIIFMILLVIGEFLNQENCVINKKITTRVVMISIILLLSMYFIMVYNFKFTGSITEFSIWIMTILFLLIYLYVINRKNNMKLILVIIVCELSIISYISFFNNPHFKMYDRDTMDRYLNVLSSEKGIEKSFLDNDDSNYTDYYRIFVPYNSVGWSISNNINLLFDYKGIMSYDSTYSSSLNDLSGIVNIHDSLHWMLSIHDSELMDYVGVKYAIITNENELINDNYKYVFDYGYFAVYENENYVNLGQTMTDIKIYEEVNESSDLNDFVIVKSKDYDEVSSLVGDEKIVGFDFVYEQKDLIAAEISTKMPGFITTSIPYDKGFKIIVNDVQRKMYNVNGGFIGFELDEGYNDVKMYFMPFGIKIGIILSASGLFLFIVMLLIRRKYKK